nr:hypothetical protein [Micromonospora sp. DSM 115978]
MGTGGWPVHPADPLDSGAYPLHTGGLNTGALDTGGLNAPGPDTGGYEAGGYGATGYGATGHDTNGYDPSRYDTGGFDTGRWTSRDADPLTDTGASQWGADDGTGAHALWQPADTGEVE